MERFYHGGTKNTEMEIWKNVTHDSYQEENRRRKFGNNCLLLPHACLLATAYCQLPTSSSRLTPHACLLATANCLLLPHASRLTPSSDLLVTANCQLPVGDCQLPTSSPRLMPHAFF